MTTEHQPIDRHDQHADRHGTSPRLEQYFKAMVKAEASDLHLKVGRPPHVRVSSVIRATKAEPLTGDEITEMAMEVLTEEQRAFLIDHGSVDVAHELQDSDRFRINIFRQRGEISIAVRRVSRKIPSFSELNLPPVVQKIAEEGQGLVLLSGATGCGKSTTIASMLEHINQTRPCHIVTIEDPIEYIYTDKKALVNQREVGIDVESFESALKYLMREDPDIVLVGEMRDRETFQAALSASETGHMVFGTVHASSAAQTIGRVLDLFPAESRDLIRQSLSFNLKAIVCQKLLKGITAAAPRLPAVEILLTNPTVRRLLMEGRDHELGDVIRANERDGMQSFTRSLMNLIERELIEPAVAYEEAPNVEELKMMLKGISANRSGLIR